MANARTPTVTASGAGSSFLFSRMSSLPVVNSALKAYENGKQNSKVMKYGAEMVESSVKSLSKPVFEKLEPTLGQIDDFARTQLDKVKHRKDSARSSNDMIRPDSNYFAHRSRNDSIDSVSSSSSSRQPSFDSPSLRKRSDSQSSQQQRPLTSSNYQYSSTQSVSNNHYSSYGQSGQVGSVAIAPSQQFSGWKGVVASVGTASAAGVAIFSEESMKSLKYCLQWLQYAVHHIEHQIGLLRTFLVSLASPSKSTEIVPSTAASTLASIKKEVVDTLRKVISIVSRYAGACLPDPAKISVRQFILSMPVRWATLNNESVPSTPIGSPSLGPIDRSPDEIAALNETSERATRVLVFANESSDMLKSVAGIFKDSVDKAENWMDKLRYVGMTPQNSDGLP
ncbi:transcription factor Opi1-domain-containing protein, partial [Lobosporangium transversale]